MKDKSFFIKNIPNALTVFRIVLTPIICVLMFSDTKITRIFAVIIAFIASITDFFDGRIARKYNICSAFGRCMDPIADKTLVMALIVMLIYLKKAFVFPCIAILFREFVVSGIREFVAKEKQIVIKVSKLSKIKTATQMFSLLFLMIFATNNFLYITGNILLTIAAILSLITSIQYIKSIQDIILR